MNTIAIEAQARTEMGKKATKALREQGLIPAVLYGGDENVHFSVTLKQIKNVVYTDKFVIAEITVDGKTYKTILKDSDFDPVTEQALHLDFQELTPGTKVKVNVPIRLTGFARGVKNGGVLTLNLRQLAIKALPKDLVTEIVVDVTELRIGKSIKVRDLKTDLEIMTPGGNPIVQVIVPRALRSAGIDDEDEETEEGAATEGEAAAE